VARLSGHYGGRAQSAADPHLVKPQYGAVIQYCVTEAATAFEERVAQGQSELTQCSVAAWSIHVAAYYDGLLAGPLPDAFGNRPHLLTSFAAVRRV
jgi:hypothetical protein